MRTNNIEQNSLPNNSSQTDNTLFLLKPLLDYNNFFTKEGKTFAAPPHKRRPELGAYPGHHISLSHSQANPNSNPIKESSSSRSKVATTTTPTKEKCLPRPTSREPPLHSFFLQRFQRGIHSQPTSTDRPRERGQQTNAAPLIHKKDDHNSQFRENTCAAD
jgi:hypothetical protein